MNSAEHYIVQLDTEQFAFFRAAHSAQLNQMHFTTLGHTVYLFLKYKYVP